MFMLSSCTLPPFLGSRPYTLLCLYRSSTLSKLDYGCQVYSSATTFCLRILVSMHHAGVWLAKGLPIVSHPKHSGPHRQSLPVRFWYRSNCLPGSKTFNILSDSTLDNIFSIRHRCPQPFSCRAKMLHDEMSLPHPAIASTRFLSLATWELPKVHLHHLPPAGKTNIPQHIIKLHFLDDASHHVGCI